MRLWPPVSKEEAFTFITAQAATEWGPDAPKEMERQLRTLADNLAYLSSVMLPDELDPDHPR